MFNIKDGFDVVIGNPPYVVIQADIRDDNLLQLFRTNYCVASFKIDLYHLFIEKGINLLSKGGAISLITPSNFASNNYTVKLRRFLLTNAALYKLVFIDEAVFEADVHNLVFIACRKTIEGNETSFLNATISDQYLLTEEKTRITQADLLDDMCMLVPSNFVESTNIIKKINNTGINLGKIASVNFGMQLRDRKKYPSDVIKVTDTTTLLSKFHRECYTGKDIHPYFVHYSGLKCFFNPDAKRGGCWDKEVHNEKNKILVRQIGYYPEGGLDSKGYAVLNTAFIIIPKTTSFDIKFILGVLNSSTMQFYWITKFRDNRKTFPKIKGEYMKLLPFPKTEETEQTSIISLVNRILTAKEADPTADTSALEAEIDKIVYELYGLTPEEIAIVEDLFKKK